MSEKTNPDIVAVYTQLDANLADAHTPFDQETDKTVGANLLHYGLQQSYVDVTDAYSTIPRYTSDLLDRTNTLRLQATPSGELWATQKYDRHRPRSNFHVPIGKVVSLEVSDPRRVDWIPLARFASGHTVLGQLAPKGTNAYWECAPRTGGVVEARISDLSSGYFHNGIPGSYYYDDQMQRHFINGLKLKNKTYEDKDVRAEVMTFQAVQYVTATIELLDDPESVVMKELVAGTLKAGRGVSSDTEALRRHMAYAETLGIDTVPYIRYLGSTAAKASILCDIGAIREEAVFIEQAISLAGELHNERLARSVSPSQGMHPLYNKIVKSAHVFDTELAKRATRSIGSPAIKARLLTKMAIETEDDALLDDAFQVVSSTWTPDQQPAYLLRMHQTASEYDTDHADRIVERLPAGHQLRLRLRQRRALHS